MVNKRAVLVVSLIALLGASGLYGLYATPGADKTAYATSTASTSPAGARGEPGGAHGAGITVQTAIVENRDFPVVLHTFGHVQAPQTVAVAARTASQITAIHVKDGQMVRAGDLLFSLDDRQAKADLARDQAILAKDNALLAAANTGLERARTLRDENTGTQQAYETALSVQKSTEATIAADQATIDADQVALSLLQIHAPIDGRLGTVQVAIGDLVGQSGTASTSLVTITAVDPIDVDFTLPEDRLQTFKQLLDSGARPQVVAKVSGTDTVIGQGMLDFIDSAVDTASGTIRMRATFENGAQKLWPGQYVDVDVEEETLAQVPVVPTVAVQFGQSGPYVYRLKDDDTVEVRPIAVAADDGTSSAIKAGLSSGDRIVIEGQSRLKPGERVSVASAAPATG
ncbi:efflux RND transporter periplasmic adaptor subunit [Mycoplana dimorpha]|uniref:Multidrug efflux system membrane fusion protein n=1 Tax=Mycoplana dimorpha TaxID=28320 RepID=A0A2T5B816_MYCDI|nr:efflux RND transporter periplasmic adaptor subunit [Mycoplana dimorpha]PTM95132.1 multidrug efflux system membrane fusion protein [Mycoplana dimorpha]